VKKIIISLSVLMMITLLIVMFFYQTDPKLTTPSWERTLEEANEKKEVQEPEPMVPIYVGDSVAYSLQHDEVSVTYDHGSEWVRVPVEKDALFAGEYSGNKQELIENSFILTNDRALFLSYEGGIHVTYSLDQGETWKKATITEEFPPIRFRKVKFLNESFGYVIISGDRTMSQEWTTVFLTNDGGETWRETNHSNVTRLIGDGGFVDENTGFLSFGTINPTEPDFYVTQDAGDTWNKATILIPEEYQRIFVMAETPFKEGDHLAMFINQGPNGDYEGGRVKGKFLSTDNGVTWEFSMEVSPDEEN